MLYSMKRIIAVIMNENRDLGRKQMILLLIGLTEDSASSKQKLGGITRIQKLLFLLEKELGIVPSNSSFGFINYKKGPYSRELYDDLELLENLGFIQSVVTGDQVEDEEETTSFTFEELIYGKASSPSLEYEDGIQGDLYESKAYHLTSKGLLKVQDLLSGSDLNITINGIRRIKSQFSNLSLSDLLYYVYTKYPETTTESDIKEQVLGKKRGKGK